MFLLCVSSGAQRWLDAGGSCPCVDTQGSLSPALLRTLRRIQLYNSEASSDVVTLEVFRRVVVVKKMDFMHMCRE